MSSLSVKLMSQVKASQNISDSPKTKLCFQRKLSDLRKITLFNCIKVRNVNFYTKNPKSFRVRRRQTGARRAKRGRTTNAKNTCFQINT